VYQTLVSSHLGVSKFGFLSICPFRIENHNEMSILPLTPKLHHFGLQNYYTHPTQNDVVLAINFFFFLKKKKSKKKKKKKKMKIGGWLEPPP
jgi:hypothetical protein